MKKFLYKILWTGRWTIVQDGIWLDRTINDLVDRGVPLTDIKVELVKPE
jgi:hypothetical protein